MGTRRRGSGGGDAWASVPRWLPGHTPGAQNDAGWLMMPGAGAEDDDSVVTAVADKIRLPAVVNLSAERLLSEGAFLLEDSQGLFMWLGRYDSMIR